MKQESQAGQQVRTKEEIVKQVLKDAKIEFGYHEISAYSIEQMCYAAIGLYEAQQELSKAKGLRDRRHDLELLIAERKLIIYCDESALLDNPEMSEEYKICLKDEIENHKNYIEEYETELKQLDESSPLQEAGRETEFAIRAIMGELISNHATITANDFDNYYSQLVDLQNSEKVNLKPDPQPQSIREDGEDDIYDAVAKYRDNHIVEPNEKVKVQEDGWISIDKFLKWAVKNDWFYNTSNNTWLHEYKTFAGFRVFRTTKQLWEEYQPPTKPINSQSK